MRVRLVSVILLALAVAAIVGCGKQKPATPVAADTTAACCDSAALSNCCPGDSAADCGGCVTPSAPADTASDAPAPCPSGG
jgi:hypothetical protein